MNARDHAIFGKMPPHEQTLLLYEDARTSPIGGITLAGRVIHGRGVPGPSRLRVYGSYALMLVISGRGNYRDANIADHPLEAGDLVLVFPEHGHWYGPTPGQTWDEMYVVFNGPQFDLWREHGIMSPSRPVIRLDDPDEWRSRLEHIITLPGKLEQTAKLLSVLSEAFGETLPDTQAEAEWLVRAKRRLETDLGAEVSAQEVASEIGMGFDSFRARFVAATGTPPARYRALHRIEAAKPLLLYTHLTLAEIAVRLGYRDEFYFSKRFKHHVGHSPQRFRNQR